MKAAFAATLALCLPMAALAQAEPISTQSSNTPQSTENNSAKAGDSPPANNDLNLLCFGGGNATKSTVSTAYGWNNSGGSANAMAFGQRSQGFEDQVSLRVSGSEGSVRMPRTMLPPIHGGQDGWFKLKDIRFKENEITGSVAVNALNNPKLRLDRYTGMISISGKAGDYTGQCQKFDPAQLQRKF